MKKMTKILSLVLALAMVLGMTAFAGTPSKLIMVDDFTDIPSDVLSSTSINTALPAVRPNPTNDSAETIIDNSYTLTPGVYKYYNYKGATHKFITTEDGQIRFQRSANSWNNAEHELIYALPTPYTYDAEKNVAVVGQIGYRPYDTPGQKNFVSYRGLAGVLANRTADVKVTTYPIEGDPVATAAEAKAATYGTGVVTNETLSDNKGLGMLGVGGYEIDSEYFCFPAGAMSGNDVNLYQPNGSSAYLAANRNKFLYNEDYTLEFVVRPTTSASSSVITDDDGNALPLDVIKSVNGIHPNGRGIYFNTRSSSATSYPANESGTYDSKVVKSYTNWEFTSVDGFVFRTPQKLKAEYFDFRAYEVSLDPADFYVDTEDTITEDLKRDDDLTIVFSQPIRTVPDSGTYQIEEGNTVNTYNYEPLVERLVVTKGETELVYGTDYTAVVNDEIYDEIGGAVKGSLTISITGGMDYSDSYTVTLPNEIKNIAAITMSPDNNHVVTFNVEAAPTFDIAIAAAEGLNANGAAVTADAMAGKTVYFTANATNTTGRDVEGAIAIGIYDANGNLVKYAAMNKEFVTAGEASFGAAFKMEEGYTAKAYVKGTASIAAFQ